MRSIRDELKRPQNLLRGFDPVRLVRGPRRRNAEVVTAAILGAAVGAGLVYLLAQRSGGGRRLRPMMRSLRRNVAEYAGSARDAIDEAVESELKDLRRSIRRQRKRFGV